MDIQPTFAVALAVFTGKADAVSGGLRVIKAKHESAPYAHLETEKAL